MKGRTHLAVGLGVGVLASISQPPEHIPIILVTTGVASLAADLDGNNLLNKRITKTAKLFKKIGVTAAIALMILSLMTIFLDLGGGLSFLNKSWFTLQSKLLLFGLGAVMFGFALRSQETLKNIFMSIIALILIYYAANNEIWWLVMFALYIGLAGWFPHRGATHTVWALLYWMVFSFLLEEKTGIERLALFSTLSYLSHIVGDMLTKRGVKFFWPLLNKVFRIKT